MFRLRCRSKGHFAVFLLLVLNGSISCVMADRGEVQPLYGFAWPTKGIPVRIESSKQHYARDAVLKAMNTWNFAQQWFIMRYMAGAGNPLLFHEADRNFTSLITIAFNETQTSKKLGTTEYRVWFDVQGVLTKITVSISLDLTSRGSNLSEEQIQAVATHELGHALGLNDTEFPDLMNPYFLEYNATLPSTLNLYTVYLLSKVNSIKDMPTNPVKLPESIPYAMIPPEAVQEDGKPITKQEMPRPIFEFILSVLWMRYGPVSILEILVTFLAVGLVLAPYRALRQRRIQARELAVAEDNTWKPAIMERDSREAASEKPSVKVCYHCGAKIARESRICWQCELPVVYLGADTHRGHWRT